MDLWNVVLQAPILTIVRSLTYKVLNWWNKWAAAMVIIVAAIGAIQAMEYGFAMDVMLNSEWLNTK